MPITYWNEEEVEQHTRRAVAVAVGHERDQTLAVLAQVQVKYASDACGVAADLIKSWPRPESHLVNPVLPPDELSKFGF